MVKQPHQKLIFLPFSQPAFGGFTLAALFFIPETLTGIRKTCREVVADLPTKFRHHEPYVGAFLYQLGHFCPRPTDPRFFFLQRKNFVTAPRVRACPWLNFFTPPTVHPARGFTHAGCFFFFTKIIAGVVSGRWLTHRRNFVTTTQVGLLYLGYVLFFSLTD